MAFNHYARLKAIIETEPKGWYIKRINSSTTATNFKGEKRHFDHYYRLYTVHGEVIKFGKFQQIDRLAQILDCDASDLPIVS